MLWWFSSNIDLYWALCEHPKRPCCETVWVWDAHNPDRPLASVEYYYKHLVFRLQDCRRELLQYKSAPWGSDSAPYIEPLKVKKPV